jgi:uncharacterized hydantoinase/oxoprolinase family protein
MKYLIASLIAGLALAGCQSTKLDEAIAKNLPKICSGAAQIHSAFVVVAATGTVPAKAVKNERVAYAAVRTVCADPGSVNSSTALATAAEAYAAMIRALREAE